LRDDTHYPDKVVVSVFEPHTQIIRKGKLAKPTEFGCVAKIQEAEGQVITDYVVCAPGHTDRDLWVPALERHMALFGHPPRLGGRWRVCLADEGTLGAGPRGASRCLAVAAERTTLARRTGGPAMADRQRRTHQRVETLSRAPSVPIPGGSRHAALGRARGHRQQPHGDRAGPDRMRDDLVPIGQPMGAPRGARVPHERTCLGRTRSPAPLADVNGHFCTRK